MSFATLSVIVLLLIHSSSRLTRLLAIGTNAFYVPSQPTV